MQLMRVGRNLDFYKRHYLPVTVFGIMKINVWALGGDSYHEHLSKDTFFSIRETLKELLLAEFAHANGQQTV